MSTKSNSRGRRRLGLEQLDARICLSVNPVFSEGVLFIGGSRESDTILIGDNSRGVVSVQDGDSGQRWEFRGVERVAGDGGDGDDTIRFTRRGSGDSPIPELDIKAGDGHDEVLISLLLPAVQKIRESAARVHVDLGAGNDQLRVNANGVANAELDIAAGDGDDDVAVGLLLPAVQKVREAAAQGSNQGWGRWEVSLELGGGDDRLAVNATGVGQVDLDIAAGDDNDDVAIGMLLPAVQKVRESAARVHVDLGAGDDRLAIDSAGYADVTTFIDAGTGNDVVKYKPLFAFRVEDLDSARLNLVALLGEGDDRLVIDGAGYADVTTFIDAGAGDDRVRHKMFAIVDRTRLNVEVLLGAGSDSLELETLGYCEIRTVINTGPAGDGHDTISANHQASRRSGRVHLSRLPLDGGMDVYDHRAVGYAVEMTMTTIAVEYLFTAL